MISGFIESAVLRAQLRTGVGSNMIVWLAVAGLLALFALVFLTIALYAWLATLYGSPLAALAVGLLYAVLAGIAVGAGALAQRHNREVARQRLAIAAARQAQLWPLDPKMLALGLQLGKSIGWRRMLPLAVAGVGILAAVATGRSLNAAETPPPEQG